MLDVYRECQTLKLKSGFQKQCICLIFKVPLLKSETVVYIASAVYSSEWITVFFQKIGTCFETELTFYIKKMGKINFKKTIKKPPNYKMKCLK